MIITIFHAPHTDRSPSSDHLLPTHFRAAQEVKVIDLCCYFSHLKPRLMSLWSTGCVFPQRGPSTAGWKVSWLVSCSRPWLVSSFGVDLFPLSGQCVEKRAFYRLISGLHASINVHLSARYLLDGEIHKLLGHLFRFGWHPSSCWLFLSFR